MARISANLAPSAPVACGAALTVNKSHHGKTIMLDTAAGSTLTLPSATASGLRIRAMISVLATSNSHKVQTTTTDIMQGMILSVGDGPSAHGWQTADDSDTVTLDRSTTGSVERGEFVDFYDALAGVWLVSGVTTSSGTEATPFSAAVS